MNLTKLDDDRRIALLNSALKEFASKGFDAASTNIIAKDAGISKALMFHYIENKKELFLFVYDYFEKLLDEEYYSKIDFKEQDLFTRLRQTYVLQIQLIKKYPAILDFDKLDAPTKSAEINSRISQNSSEKTISECSMLFSNVDDSLYRKNLDIKKCKQFILWANIGFTKQILDEIKQNEQSSINQEEILSTLDSYFDELRKIFYAESEVSENND